MPPKGADRITNSEDPDQGPVVQSIVSLTTSLRCQFVKYMPTTLSNPLLFFVGKNVKIFCIAWICNIDVLNFNETLTNDIVNFEQLAPDCSI